MLHRCFALPSQMVYAVQGPGLAFSRQHVEVAGHGSPAPAPPASAAGSGGDAEQEGAGRPLMTRFDAVGAADIVIASSSCGQIDQSHHRLGCLASCWLPYVGAAQCEIGDACTLLFRHRK